MTKTATKNDKAAIYKIYDLSWVWKNKFQTKDINVYKSKSFWCLNSEDILTFGDEKCLG